MEQNLLVAARNEYTEKLQDVLTEGIYKGIKYAWEECKKEGKKNLLLKFQNKLCQIPKWNQDVINECCSKNLISEEYLDKILEAVFLSNVKILSVVKLNNSKKSIDISVPNTKHFIHRCYIETARRFYTDPYLIDDRDGISHLEIQRNVKRSFIVIKDSIEKTIRSMIPMEDILTKYLEQEGSLSSKSSESDLDFERENEPIEEQILYKSEHDNPDSVDDIFYNQPTQSNQEPPQQEPPQQEPPQQEPQQQEPPQLFEETKNIDITSKDTSFFSD